MMLLVYAFCLDLDEVCMYQAFYSDRQQSCVYMGYINTSLVAENIEGLLELIRTCKKSTWDAECFQVQDCVDCC